MKPREFYINGNNLNSVSTEPFNCDDLVHVREVRRINWGRVWKSYFKNGDHVNVPTALFADDALAYFPDL